MGPANSVPIVYINEIYYRANDTLNLIIQFDDGIDDNFQTSFCHRVQLVLCQKRL